MPHPPLIVVMGVSGSGKSVIGSLVAKHLGVAFADADDLHPPSNVRAMAAGRPLTDDERWPWLDAVGDAVAGASASGIIMACSALKRSYRDAIRAKAPDARFVHLDGTPELLRARIGARTGHFMPPALLDSQLETLQPLEPDEPGITVSIDQTPVEIVEEIAGRLGH